MKSCKILRYGAVCGLAALAAVGCSVDDAETIRVRELTAAEHELFVPASAEPPRYSFIPTAGSGSRRSTTSEAGLRSTGRNSTATGWFRSPLRRTIRSAAWPNCASCSTAAHGPTRSASSSTAWFRRSNVRLPTRRSAAASRPSPRFEIDTNIPLGDFAVATAYVGPTRDWIRSVQPEQGMLVVDTKPNPGDDVCKAVVNP